MGCQTSVRGLEIGVKLKEVSLQKKDMSVRPLTKLITRIMETATEKLAETCKYKCISYQ